MNKKQFVYATLRKLNENKARKHVEVRRRKLYIEDEFGHRHPFYVKPYHSNVVYNYRDVMLIVNSCMEVIKDCLRTGDTLKFIGLFSLGLKYRQDIETTCVNTNERIVIPGRYLPKFSYGRELRACAMSYADYLKEAQEEFVERDDDFEDLTDDDFEDSPFNEDNATEEIELDDDEMEEELE